jgi:hypothetical protein
MLHLWKLVLLFVVLTPGILLTIPPVGKKIFGSGKSSLIAACVHAVIFVVLMNLFNVEGFQLATPSGPVVARLPNRTRGASMDTNNIYNDLSRVHRDLLKADAMLTEQKEYTNKYSEEANRAMSVVATKNEEVMRATMEAEKAKVEAEQANEKFQSANNGIAEQLALLNGLSERYINVETRYNQSLVNDMEKREAKIRARQQEAEAASRITISNSNQPPPTIVVDPRQQRQPTDQVLTATALPPSEAAAAARNQAAGSRSAGSGIMGNLLNAVGLAPPSARDARGQPIVIQNNYICNGVRGWVKTADPAIVVLWVEERKEQQSFAPQTCVPA